jgi:hypothetical protein
MGNIGVEVSKPYAKNGGIIVDVRLKRWYKIFNSIIYSLKQFLPLTYRSHYGKDGKEMFCVWCMWFGKCFNVEEYAIGDWNE